MPRRSNKKWIFHRFCCSVRLFLRPKLTMANVALRSRSGRTLLHRFHDGHDVLRQSCRLLPVRAENAAILGNRLRSSDSSSVRGREDDDDDGATRLEREIEDAGARYSGEISIREAENRGYGLYASRNFRRGELVVSGNALEITNVPDAHTIQTDRNRHVRMDLPARFVNHSCGMTANIGARPNVKGAYDFFALRTIRTGQELLFDYETTEYEISADFECKCGSTECRGRLRGFKYHRRHVLRSFPSDFIAPYLLET